MVPDFETSRSVSIQAENLIDVDEEKLTSRHAKQSIDIFPKDFIPDNSQVSVIGSSRQSRAGHVALSTDSL